MTDARAAGGRIDTKTLSTICAKCRIDFVDERNLRAHFLKYKNQASFQCELCHKSYVRSDSLLEHQRVHVNEALYKCIRCFYSCNQIYDIYEHMHGVHKINIESIYKCPYDDLMLRDKDTLLRHVKCHRAAVKRKHIGNGGERGGKKHKDEESTGSNKECEVAVKEEHLSDQEEMLPENMLECNLNSQENLLVAAHARHMNNKKQTNAKEDEGPDEDGDAITSEQLESINEALDEIDKSTLIDFSYVINNTLISTSHLERNNAMQHQQQRSLCYFTNIKCAYCSQAFNLKNDLKNHLTSAHDTSKSLMIDLAVKNEKFQCTICQLKFDFAIDLTHHMGKEHTKYECENCSKVYNQVHTLRKHMKVCNATAPTIDESGQEVRPSGRAAQNIVCEICDKTFKRNWNLKQHMANIHKITKS